MAQRDRGILDCECDDDEETEVSWIIINGDRDHKDDCSEVYNISGFNLYANYL